MKSIKVKKMTLGSDHPKIAVSLMGKDRKELRQRTFHLLDANPDVIEWRIDTLAQLPKPNKLNYMIKMISDLIEPLPLIATFRTSQEGGNLNISNQKYFQLLTVLSNNADIDFLDIELMHSKKLITNVIDQAHQNDIQVIMSNHDFDRTPLNEEMIDRMNRMQELNGDLAKIAVMPNDTSDVFRLMEISKLMEKRLSIPIITMAMGDLGKISRIGAKITGSSLTFASPDANVQSAPGQIPVDTLRKTMDIL